MKNVLMVLGFVALSRVAAADWLMVGPNEFQPDRTGSVADAIVGGHAAFYTGASSSMTLMAPVKLPLGSVVSSLYCQVRDSSDAYEVQVRLRRYDHLDTSGAFPFYDLATVATGVAEMPGPTKVYDVSIPASLATVDDWSGSGPTTYYNYVLEFVSAQGCGSRCIVYNCAIGYNP